MIDKYGANWLTIELNDTSGNDKLFSCLTAIGDVDAAIAGRSCGFSRNTLDDSLVVAVTGMGEVVCAWESVATLLDVVASEIPAGAANEISPEGYPRHSVTMNAAVIPINAMQ